MTNSSKTIVSKKEITTEHIRDFFDDLIAIIEKDKNDMLIGTVNEKKAEMYESMIRKDKDFLYDNVIKVERLRTLSEMLQDFLNNLDNKKLPNSLAFSFVDSSLNVIAFVNDDEDAATSELISSKSKVLSKYYPKGYKIETKILEKENTIHLPENYKEFPLNKLA